MKRRLVSALLIAATLALGWAAAQPERTIVIGSPVTEESFDPIFQLRTGGEGMVRLTFETLVTFNEEMQIVPLLAESWTISEDGRTYRFALRQGVRFHDGTPFNAEAVKYSWERWLDPASGARNTSRLAPLLETLTVVDEYTLDLTTVRPFPEMLTNLTSGHSAIVSPTAARSVDVAQFGRVAAVGTGPFKFEGWVGIDRVDLVRNPDYWGDLDVWAERISYRIIPEMASLIAALEAGEVDIALAIPAEEALRLQDDPRIDIASYQAFNTIKIPMLLTVAPFDDVRVRQALNYAIDKEVIVNSVLGGFGAVTTTVTYPGLPYRVDQVPYTYDPARARALLAEAGLPNGFSTTLAFTPSLDKGREVVEIVAAYLADVGVMVELNSMDAATLSAHYRETSEVPARRLFVEQRTAFGVDFNLSRMYTSATIDEDNRARYFNQQVEDLLLEARFSFDEELRARNYAEVQRIVWEDAPEIFLYSLTPTYGVRSGITDLWIQSDGVPRVAEVRRE
jgi:glutathione transport system substrate-binding protein